MSVIGGPVFGHCDSDARRVWSHPMVYLWSITLPVIISNIGCAPPYSKASLNNFVVSIAPVRFTTGTVYLLLVLTNPKTKNQVCVD